MTASRVAEPVDRDRQQLGRFRCAVIVGHHQFQRADDGAGVPQRPLDMVPPDQK